MVLEIRFHQKWGSREHAGIPCVSKKRIRHPEPPRVRLALGSFSVQRVFLAVELDVFGRQVGGPDIELTFP